MKAVFVVVLIPFLVGYSYMIEGKAPELSIIEGIGYFFRILIAGFVSIILVYGISGILGKTFKIEKK